MDEFCRERHHVYGMKSGLISVSYPLAKEKDFVKAINESQIYFRGADLNILVKHNITFVLLI